MKFQTKTAVPKDASSVILLNDAGEVLWAQRNPLLKFLGGYHAFPGGKLEASDEKVRVENCADENLAKFIACAARETFEEIGVLLVRNGDKLTSGQRASLHDDLISGRMTFAEILELWGLWLDATDFFYTGFWTTPTFSPVRFKTRFFLAVCPPKQKPFAAISELQNIEFIKPSDALELWKNSEVLIAPPVFISLQTLAEDFSPQSYRETGEILNKDKEDKQDNSGIQKNPLYPVHPCKFSSSASLRFCGEKLFEKAQKFDGNINYLELNSRLICFPLKTDTLPPATHTNCFIVGREKFIVIDAASKDSAEQQKLFELIDSFAEKGFVCSAIIVSHLHQDHFGGETVLQSYLREKFGWQILISAHQLTAESLRGKVEIERFITDNEIFELQDEHGKAFELKALHAPGHARGHLCFYDDDFGFLLSGDNVVGTGSVLIAPPEGNMRDYLDSLQRMKNLPNLRFLCGSHGSAIFDAKEKIESYIAHRLDRERKILDAIKNGAKTPREIVEKVYQDVSPELWQLAEKSVEAHLEKIEGEKV